MLLLAALPALGHPFHVTMARAEHDPVTGALEVSIRVHDEDLQAALRRMLRRDVRLTSKPKLDGAIHAYVAKSFVPVAESATLGSAVWVGREVLGRGSWLHVEFPVKGTPTGWSISNRMFVELNADQTNTIHLDAPTGAETFITTRDKTVRFRGKRTASPGRSSLPHAGRGPSSPKPVTPKPESPKPKSPKPESPKPESPKPGTSKPGTSKPESPKVPERD